MLRIYLNDGIGYFKSTAIIWKSRGYLQRHLALVYISKIAYIEKGVLADDFLLDMGKDIKHGL